MRIETSKANPTIRMRCIRACTKRDVPRGIPRVTKEVAISTVASLAWILVPTSYSWADTDAISPIDRCKTDACREMMMKIEEKRKRGPSATKPLIAPTPKVESIRSDPNEESMGSKRAAAEKQAEIQRSKKEEAAAAARKASMAKDLEKQQAKIKKEKAKKRAKGKYSLVGTLTTAGLLASLGMVIAGGGFEDLKALDGEAALDKAKKVFDESSNKYVVAASSAGVLLVDYVANLPVLNLLLPGLLELSGQVLALVVLLNYISDRGGGKTQNPAEDLVKYTSELPQDFAGLVEPVKTGVLTTVEKATGADYASLPDYVVNKWESVDTKLETGLRGGAALLLLLLSNKLLHAPLLGLLLPKTVELAGVVAAITAVQKYVVDGEDFEADALGFLQGTLKIPGLLPEAPKADVPVEPAPEPETAPEEEA